LLPCQGVSWVTAFSHHKPILPYDTAYMMLLSLSYIIFVVRE
jgi:hypothetical protein